MHSLDQYSGLLVALLLPGATVGVYNKWLYTFENSHYLLVSNHSALNIW